MNERIKELVAKTYHYDTYEMVQGQQVKLYGFTYAGITELAELIVRECAKVADVADENKCEWIGGNILTHFGVEE